MRSLRPLQLALACVVWHCLAIIALPGEALAQADQACQPVSRPIFAGHGFDLDATLDPTTYTNVDAFPLLATQFAQAVQVTSALDGSNRLFVVERLGRIFVFDNAPTTVQADVFLDVSSLIQTDGEKGLLGLAFDPEFGVTGSPRFGELYVSMTVAPAQCACFAAGTCTLDPAADPNSGNQLQHCSQVVRYRATNTHGGPQPDTVVVGSRQLVLEIERPFFNHVGGTLVFGPDDYLYVSSGDGGGSEVLSVNPAQELDERLGKILRIDPRGHTTYVVPPTNPYFGDPTKAQEILHYGLRNPWRISFDRETGDLWIGDAGAGRWEEIDRVPAGTSQPMNFGWPHCEGTHHVGGTSLDCAFAHDRPVLEIPRPAAGGVVIGGHVYRGSQLPQLYGRYLFVEAGERRVWAWDRTSVDPQTGLGIPDELGVFDSIVSFGEDESGEILLPGWSEHTSAPVRRFAPAAAPGPGFPAKLSATGLFSNLGAGPLMPATGMIEYDIETPLWSDGATKRRWLALPGSQKVGFKANGAWDLPLGSVLVKHFELPHAQQGSQRIETRVLLRQSSDWLGFTYRWNETQTDADLLKVALSEDVCLDDACSATQTWTYPSPATCLSCHTAAAGRVLGLQAGQFNRVESNGVNQLRKLNCLGLFDSDIGVPSQFRRHAAIGDATATIGHRARSYLASNCAHCHRPGTLVPGSMDLRATTPLNAANVVGVVPSIDVPGLVAPRIVKPGDAANSVLWHRQNTLDPLLRMAKLTRLRDDAALPVLSAWISTALMSAPDDDDDGILDGSDNCPSAYNPGQENDDADGSGNACDPDTRPDLRATPNAPIETVVTLGGRISLGALTSNLGTGPAAASQVRFFLSQNSTFEAGVDRWVGDCFVAQVGPGQASACHDAGGQVPLDLAVLTGSQTVDRFLGACSDGLELVDESDETNGCVVHPTVIRVPEPGASARGLALLALALLSMAGPGSRQRIRPPSTGRTTPVM